jgi:hypothetical protein
MRFFVDAHALIWSQDSPELLGQVELFWKRYSFTGRKFTRKPKIAVYIKAKFWVKLNTALK